MKRMLMLWVLVFWHGSAAFAQGISWRAEGGMPQYGSIEVRDSNVSSGFTAEIDNSPSARALNVSVRLDESNKLVFGFLNKKEMVKQGTALKARYELDFPVASGSSWNIFNEAKVGLGYVSAKYDFGDSGRSLAGGQFTHALLGVSNYLTGEWRTNEAKTGLKVGADTTGSQMTDAWGSVTEWDNHRVGILGAFEVPTDNLKFRLFADFHRVRYNPERYFFVKKWTEDYRVRMETMLPLDKWEFIPSVEYRKLDIERDRRTDLERPEYGFAVIRKDIAGSKKDGFLKGIYAPWSHKSGHEMLTAAGVNSSDMSGEIYQREIVDKYSSFVLRERIIGLRLSWKFGEAEKEIRKGIDDYGAVVEDKYAFYHRGDSVPDDNSLTLKQQAERLGNVRRRIDWSGKSLKWGTAPDSGWGFRFPEETYAGRTGDCDEQSCLNNRIDRQNGYESHSVAYWDVLSSGYVGHAVTVFKDPTNGQWFLEEYGVPFKIRGLGANASKEQAMKAGLLQNSRFLALGIKNPGWAYFEVRDCTDANASNPPSYWFEEIPVETGRPAIERGAELFTKRGFLFE